MSSKALKELKRVWSKAGIDYLPTIDDTKGAMSDRAGRRPKNARTARLDLRLTPDEKRKLELIAVINGLSINEIFTRMLDLYEGHHGRVEIPGTEK